MENLSILHVLLNTFLLESNTSLYSFLCNFVDYLAVFSCSSHSFVIFFHIWRYITNTHPPASIQAAASVKQTAR